ncbi:unnamed protein product [Candidula unifasciata]|uniref:Uncharacterized protein n=1 Tax=Candidula unifasciata TaxID=100452 RepID=A0A8S3YLW8_9EUPU|nr:unnamed protein product [Candidula unifasciata]
MLLLCYVAPVMPYLCYPAVLFKSYGCCASSFLFPIHATITLRHFFILTISLLHCHFFIPFLYFTPVLYNSLVISVFSVLFLCYFLDLLLPFLCHFFIPFLCYITCVLYNSLVISVFSILFLLFSGHVTPFFFCLFFIPFLYYTTPMSYILFSILFFSHMTFFHFVISSFHFLIISPVRTFYCHCYLNSSCVFDMAKNCVFCVCVCVCGGMLLQFFPSCLSFIMLFLYLIPFIQFLYPLFSLYHSCVMRLHCYIIILL